MRGQVNMVVEAKLCYPNSFNFWRVDCATYGGALKWRRTGPILWNNACCRHCSFQCISLLGRKYFSDKMVLPGFRKAVVDQTGSRRPNSDYDLFLVQFWLWEVLWTSSQSSHWASCCQLSCKIHFLLHITIQSRNGSLLLPRIREDDISKWWCFLFSVSS